VRQLRSLHARSPNGAYLASLITGTGPRIVVFGPGINVEDQLNGALIRRFIDRLSSFERVVRVDRRGYGLSDPIPVIDSASWKFWVGDLVTGL
jgi:pimeloyl-ACP methyl ester carboxylesterase